MGYIDRFLDDYRPASGLERMVFSFALGYEVAGQAVSEIFGRYVPKIDAHYCDEDKVASWMSCLSETLPARLFELYFRPGAIGAENIPDGGAMLVANHSGFMTWDVISIVYSIFKETGRVAGGFGHRILRKSDMVKSIGSMTGTRDDAISFLKDGRLGLVCPGGAREYAKSSIDNYRVDPIAGFSEDGYGYILTALEAGVPLVPVGVVGAEETHIKFGDIKPFLDFFVDRIYYSLPLKVQSGLRLLKNKWDVVEALPLLFNMVPFPARITVNIGKPIYAQDMLEGISSREYWAVQRKHREGLLMGSERNGFVRKREMLGKVNQEVMSAIWGLLRQGRSKR